MFTDRQFRIARHWSNRELAKVALHFTGDVVNVSAWDDRDKEGGCYKDYFTNASSYSYTNFGGYRGFQGLANEYALDLTGEVPEDLKGRFDVAFNHTTLEHIFDVRKAFANLCELSRDVVIVVVPFAQVQHESKDWKDYWRFTPSCVRELFHQNGMEVMFEAESPHKHAAVYLLFVASREADKWKRRLPAYHSIREAGRWIGYRWFSRFYAVVRHRFGCR